MHARFHIVPNTVDTKVFFVAGELATTPTRLVNVALHVEVKALDVLLKAFAEVSAQRPGLTLELIGDGPLTSDLQAVASELGIGKLVHFTGRAGPAEIAEALRAADLFVPESRARTCP